MCFAEKFSILMKLIFFPFLDHALVVKSKNLGPQDFLLFFS
jgi:hypothetical protein